MKYSKVIDWSSFYNKATDTVPLLKFLYFISIPVAKILVKTNLTPTHITHMSNLSSLLSLYFLYSSNNLLFFIFQLLALVFDICDGMIARAKKLSTVFGSFYDHFSDFLKVILTLAIVGFINNSTVVWGLCFFISTLFLMNLLVNSFIKYKKVLIKQNVKKTESARDEFNPAAKKRSNIYLYLKQNKFLRNFISWCVQFFLCNLRQFYGLLFLLISKGR
jgi:hypothetical protein